MALTNNSEDPYRTAFDRCGDGSPILNDQQWAEFLEMLVDAGLLSEDLGDRFEHEARNHNNETALLRLTVDVVDSIKNPTPSSIFKLTCAPIPPLVKTALVWIKSSKSCARRKTSFLSQVVGAQQQSEVTNLSFLQGVVAQQQQLREDLAEIERSTADILSSKWAKSDLFGSTDPPVTYQPASPWKFQQANAKYLRVEDRRRARHQLQLHQCDGSTDRVLKETLFPVLEKFREVQVGLATLTSRKHRGEDEDDDPELTIAVMVRRQTASDEALIWLDNLVSAYRQLSLSPYVQQYLGSEDVSAPKHKSAAVDGVTTRHYFEFVQARSLADVLADEGLFHEHSPLFKMYARELLLAITDLLEQSTHQLFTRLTPEHVMISHLGRRLFLGKLDFGDHIDPFQRKPLEAVIQQRERDLLQDLALILFSMLSPVTLPDNLFNFRTQYLGNRAANFVFRYRIDVKSQDNRDTVCVSSGDTFSIELADDRHIDAVWNYHVSNSSVLQCIKRRYSPMEFTFRTKSTGDCTVGFSPLGNGTSRTLSISVTVCSQNFRLQSSRAQTLISFCAATVHESTPPASQPSLRQVLSHAYFKPLTESESHEAERELLERV